MDILAAMAAAVVGLALIMKMVVVVEELSKLLRGPCDLKV